MSAEAAMATTIVAPKQPETRHQLPRGAFVDALMGTDGTNKRGNLGRLSDEQRLLR